VMPIRINVHPTGENPIDTPHAFHARFASGPGPYISRGPRRQLFASPHEGETGLVTEDRLTQPSSWVTSYPLPHDSPGVGERGFGQVVTQLHQPTEPITPACDWYVQYLHAGANTSVLN
jgi:hypothetical protein